MTGKTFFFGPVKVEGPVLKGQPETVVKSTVKGDKREGSIKIILEA